MSATLTEYKGHALISLETGGRKPFSFGLAKARAILEHIDAIEGFVASGGTALDPAVIPELPPLGPIHPRAIGWKEGNFQPEPGSVVTRFSSGAEVFTNRNGRCEDAPCCGCCS